MQRTDQADAGAEQQQSASLSKHHAHHRRWLRAERHPETELARALSDVVGNGPVESDGREEQRHQREPAEQRRDEPDDAATGGAHVIQGLHAEHRLIAVHLPHDRAHRRSQRGGVTFGSDDDRHARIRIPAPAADTLTDAPLET
jgi:hypothetical protein